MSFSAHYRRVRAPQQPFLRVGVRVALLVLCLLLFYYAFVNTAMKRLSQGSWPLAKNLESNPNFPLTHYRAALNKTGIHFWMAINPGFLCPTKLLTRVGADPEQTEGASKARWVCGLKQLGRIPPKQEVSYTSSASSKKPAPPPCIVYSFTMEGSSHFEAEVLQKTNCSVYHYDPMRWAPAAPLDTSTTSRLHFEKLTIGGEDKGEHRTLELLMELNGHQWIDILRIEIHTGEYRVLERIFSDFSKRGLPFGQLLIKFHVMDWNTVKRSHWMVALFELMESKGLRLFYNQVNAYSPCCSEMSFINVNHLEKFLTPDDLPFHLF